MDKYIVVSCCRQTLDGAAVHVSIQGILSSVPESALKSLQKGVSATQELSVPGDPEEEYETFSNSPQVFLFRFSDVENRQGERP